MSGAGPSYPGRGLYPGWEPYLSWESLPGAGPHGGWLLPADDPYPGRGSRRVTGPDDVNPGWELSGRDRSLRVTSFCVSSGLKPSGTERFPSGLGSGDGVNPGGGPYPGSGRSSLGPTGRDTLRRLSDESPES